MVQKVKVRRLPMAVFYDPERDGVTQGILATFKRCRELARNSLTGWTGRYPAFPLVYGSLAHYVLEQAYRPVLDQQRRAVATGADVTRYLEMAKAVWEEENPIRSDITTSIFEESLMKTGAILPQYFKYWKTDFTTRHWIDLERTFRIPWTVTTREGREFKTFLRGRMDGAYTLPTSKRRPKAPRLFETKTLSTVNEEQLIDTLPFNLQTSMYLIALWKTTGILPAEVEYNIVRKTALRQGGKESWGQYEQRIIQDVRARQDWYFVRMHMTVDKADVERMQREIDELISDFMLWWYGLAGHYRNDASCYMFQRPCDMIKKCSYNDTTHLYKREKVFLELEH